MPPTPNQEEIIKKTLEIAFDNIRKRVRASELESLTKGECIGLVKEGLLNANEILSAMKFSEGEEEEDDDIKSEVIESKEEIIINDDPLQTSISTPSPTTNTTNYEPISAMAWHNMP